MRKCLFNWRDRRRIVVWSNEILRAQAFGVSFARTKSKWVLETKTVILNMLWNEIYPHCDVNYLFGQVRLLCQPSGFLLLAGFATASARAYSKAEGSYSRSIRRMDSSVGSHRHTSSWMGCSGPLNQTSYAHSCHKLLMRPPVITSFA